MIESPFRMCAKIPQKMCIFESEADCLIFIMGEIMKKRLFSLIVVLALVMGMMPMNVSAATFGLGLVTRQEAGTAYYEFY